MSRPDSDLVASLVEAAKSSKADPIAVWVREGTGDLEGLEVAEALVAVEAARVMGNSAALLATAAVHKLVLLPRS